MLTSLTARNNPPVRVPCGFMRIIVLGAGHVGRAIVDALYQEHEITVIDTNAERLQALADRYDVRIVEGNGTTKRVIAEAGIQDCSLFIASTSREEANLVSAMLVKKLSGAMVVVRTTSVEYLDAWREREIDVDFMVSSELETANAISGLIGIPAARQTDVFADGKVQIVEFDVPEASSVIGKPLRSADAARRTRRWSASSAATRCCCPAAARASAPATGSS